MIDRRIGQKTIVLHTIDSTNNYAAKLLRDPDTADGTVILALEQVQGKGQQGAKWQSSPNANLTFSFILTSLSLIDNRIFSLTEWVSLALADTVAHFTGKDTLVKWPNDVYVDDRKVAGILIELQSSSSAFHQAIVGIGLNVNERSFPNLPGATSMAIEARRWLILDDVRDYLLYRLNENCARWMRDPDCFQNAYLQRMYGRNQPRWFWLDGESVKGTVRGVAHDGALLWEGADGRVRQFRHKELRWT